MMVADKAAVLKVVREAIGEMNKAQAYFKKEFGPGFNHRGKQGQFTVYASKCGSPATTILCVSIVPDCIGVPRKRSDLDKTTREIFEAVEAEFRKIGARPEGIHGEDFSIAPDRPGVWYSGWSWEDKR